MKLLQERVRGKLNDFRAIERLVSSFDFEYIFVSLSDNEQEALMSLLINGDKSAGIDFLRRHETKLIEELSIRKLREMAGQLSIEYYSQLSKPELIAIIIQVKHARLAG